MVVTIMPGILTGQCRGNAGAAAEKPGEITGMGIAEIQRDCGDRPIAVLQHGAGGEMRARSRSLVWLVPMSDSRR